MLYKSFPDLELPGDSANVVLVSLNSFTESPSVSLERSLVETTDFVTGCSLFPNKIRLLSAG